MSGKSPVRVYINRHVIAANKKHDARAPPISVAKGRRITRGTTVTLIGPARVVYAPDRPLKCGASVWIECVDAIVEPT
jgi:hypothetical protein